MNEQAQSIWLRVAIELARMQRASAQASRFNCNGSGVKQSCTLESPTVTDEALEFMRATIEPIQTKQWS